MPSMTCHHCGEVKRCKMYHRDHPGAGMTAEDLAYLCGPCARELGYTTKESK